VEALDFMTCQFSLVFSWVLFSFLMLKKEVKEALFSKHRVAGNGEKGT
jgi:hypothetical protein